MSQNNTVETALTQRRNRRLLTFVGTVVIIAGAASAY